MKTSRQTSEIAYNARLENKQKILDTITNAAKAGYFNINIVLEDRCDESEWLKGLGYTVFKHPMLATHTVRW